MLSQWVERHFCAAHESDDGKLHGHTWVVRVYWPYDDTDVLVRATALERYVAKVDHTVLPNDLRRAEELAGFFAAAVDGVTRVDVWREREGYGATWTA